MFPRIVQILRTAAVGRNNRTLRGLGTGLIFAAEGCGTGLGAAGSVWKRAMPCRPHGRCGNRRFVKALLGGQGHRATETWNTAGACPEHDKGPVSRARGGSASALCRTGRAGDGGGSDGGRGALKAGAQSPPRVGGGGGGWDAARDQG